MDLKPLYYTGCHLQQESVYDKRKKAEGQEIDRQGEDKEDRTKKNV